MNKKGHTWDWMVAEEVSVQVPKYFDKKEESFGGWEVIYVFRSSENFTVQVTY